jgi:iron complex outermembrane recepter protein
MKYQRQVLLSLGLAAFTASSSPGFAQPGDAAEASASTPGATATGLEEIVVTARRKEENLQDVPLAIAAFSADDLARESINSAQDLFGKIGSMVIGANATTRNAQVPTIRGQGATFGGGAGVVMYWDEVALPADSFSNNQGGPGMFFDLQSMQVLKGPQGTLFGRNTTGGAILLDPVKPQDTFAARVQGETGNLNSRGYEGVLNVPLVTDRVLLRVGGQDIKRDGFTTDVISGEDYDDKDYWTGRVGLTLRAGDNIENTLMVYRTKRNENGTGNVFDAMNSDQIAGFLAAYTGVPLVPGLPANEQFGCKYFNSQAPSTNCGQDIAAEQATRDIRHIQLSGAPKDKLNTGAYINTFSWEISDELQLRNILSQTYYKRRFSWDQDGSRAALNDLIGTSLYSSDTDTTTEELQLLGENEDIGLSWVVGAYYEKRKPNSVQQNQSVALFALTTQTYAVSTRSMAAYAQGTYDLSAISSSLEGWSLTAGVRETKDEMWGDAKLVTPVFENIVDEDISQNATTWLSSVSYQADKTMYYGKVARGYKSGGFTALAVNPANVMFEPEYVDNYELGVKSDIEVASKPVRLNAAVYYSDYTDMQRATAESYQGAFGAATLNAGKAEISGFEMDFTMLLTDRLQFIGNYSYTDGKFKEFLIPRSSMTAQKDCTGADIANGALGDYSCIPFTDIPENQYSLSLNYELPLDASIGTVEAALTYAWVDDRYSAPVSVPEEEPGAWLESFHLVNASITWREIYGSRFDLQVFGTNLTDEDYRISNSNVWNELGYQNSIWGEPRIYGVRLSYRWGEG